jgi:hypothetical protein
VGCACSGVPTFVVSVNLAHLCRLLVISQFEGNEDYSTENQTGRREERRREVDCRHPCTFGLPTHEGQ